MPRVGLTHERVVAEAAVVADEVGLESLTLAAVAKRVGVAIPSLYKHIDGLDALRRDLAVLGVRELTAAASAAAVGRAGRDALHAIAGAHRDYASDPWTPPTPASSMRSAPRSPTGRPRPRPRIAPEGRAGNGDHPGRATRRAARPVA
jgi:AcrR family transcriptional regulator